MGTLVRRIQGKAVYGPRPSAAEMGERCKRDGIKFADLVPCLNFVRHYYVEGWAWQDGDSEAAFYSYRRDGKIGVLPHQSLDKMILQCVDDEPKVEPEVAPMVESEPVPSPNKAENLDVENVILLLAQVRANLQNMSIIQIGTCLDGALSALKGE